MGRTEAERVGCCLAGSKEDCKRPPCPCNMEAWTPLDRVDLAQVTRDLETLAAAARTPSPGKATWPDGVEAGYDQP